MMMYLVLTTNSAPINILVTPKLRLMFTFNGYHGYCKMTPFNISYFNIHISVVVHNPLPIYHYIIEMDIGMLLTSSTIFSVAKCVEQ